MLRIVAGQSGRAIVRAMKAIPGFGRAAETARYRMANGGRIYNVASFGPVARGVTAILVALGVNETAEFFLGDDLIPDFVGDIVSAINPFDNVNHPSPVVKSWTNALTGLGGVKLMNGQLGAEKADGTWTYWKPKKPVAVVYSSGNDNKTLTKAYDAVKRDAAKMKKVVDHYYPRPKPKEKVKIVKVPVGRNDPDLIIAQN